MKEQMKEPQKLKGMGKVMNRFLRGSLLPVLSGIALVIALTGCGGGGGQGRVGPGCAGHCGCSSMG